MDENLPLYRQVRDQILHAICKKDLAAGRIIKVSVVARAFKTSREPALRALVDLVALGHITPSESQGFVIAGPVSDKVAVTGRVVSIEELADLVQPAEKLSNSERIYNTVEQELICHSTMGSYKLNSTKLSDHFGISRTIGSELIRILTNDGIVENTSGGKPILPRLTHHTIRNNNEVRLGLEPIALRDAMKRLPQDVVEQHLSDHRAAAGIVDQLGFADLSRLEVELHETLLAFCGNDRLIMMLRYCGIAQKFNSIYFKRYGAKGNFLSEHIEILEAIAVQNGELAKLLLHQHITRSTDSTIERLEDFRARTELETASYLSKL